MQVTIPVRLGPYQYILTHRDGTSETIQVPVEDRNAGETRVDVGQGETVMEIALSSTSNPDLDPARGQLWPAEER